MTTYRRIRLGPQGSYLDQCVEEGFAGLDYNLNQDLTGQFPSTWREFNDRFIPVYLESKSGRSRGSAGLACGALWTFCYDMAGGDIILAPDANGIFHWGRVNGGYLYDANGPLPHRRPVDWQATTFRRDEFSAEFRRSVRGPLSNVDVSGYSEELEALLGGSQPQRVSVADPDVEDPVVFALERHLEDFLVANWPSTEFGRTHQLWEEDGEIVGQQFPSDTGPIDLLALSNDGVEILVIELKKGRASDAVVGQVQRYMGYATEALAEDYQSVRGAIVALESDLRLTRALSVTTNIDFYRYEVDFRLQRQDT